MEYELYIMGAKWQIKIGEYRDLIKMGANGLCDSDQRTIYIDQGDGMSDELMNRVLMHEIMHAYTFTSGVSELLNPDLKEALSVMAENFVNMFTFQEGVLIPCKGKRKPKK
jgi:hypothetical protein